MSNASVPSTESLPSPRKLRRATGLAVLIAIVLVVVVILPAERGIDPTGIGQVIGLKELGEYKVETARQFAEDSAMMAKWREDSIAGRIPAESPPATVPASDSAHPPTARF